VEHTRQKILAENYFFTLHIPQRITIIPNKTERKHILEELERTILIEQATGADSDVEMREMRLLVDNDPDNCEDSDEEDLLCEAFEDSDDDLLEQVYVQVASFRYLNRGSTITRAPQRLDWLL